MAMEINGLRILIIDDNLDEAYTMKQRLDRSQFKHAIDFADSPRKAIEMVLSNKYIITPFDLIIVDYWMNGMLGDELALLLKNIDNQLEIILYSSDVGINIPNRINKLDILQAKGCYVKDDDEIIQSVNYILSNKQARKNCEPDYLSKRILKLKQIVSDLRIKYQNILEGQ